MESGDENVSEEVEVARLATVTGPYRQFEESLKQKYL
jgi:hypothetical protein